MQIIRRICSILFLSFYINEGICNYTIAGKQSIEQCINGPRRKYTDLEITTSELIRKEGYPAEDYVVITEDGYLLTLNRIPGPPGAPTVLLQHGLLFSSFEWTVNGKEKALAFFLADKGYDVWMGNFRGSLYSRCHVNLTTNDRRFWNFSFHQMGTYDLPTMINYITKLKKDDIIYVGHSMGTTAFYVMAIEKPEVASKVKAMFSLAPIARIYYMKGIVMILTSVTYILEVIIEYLFAGEAIGFSQNWLWKIIITIGCQLLPTQKLCSAAIFTIIGFNEAQFDYDNLMLYLHHFPAGSSALTFLHYAQGALTGKFQYRNFGKKNNLLIYNSTEPPDYDLSKIKVPIGLFWGENDYLADPEDVTWLSKSLPNKIIDYKVRDPKFNHFDFLWAKDARDLLYKDLVDLMDKYR